VYSNGCHEGFWIQFSCLGLSHCFFKCKTFGEFTELWLIHLFLTHTDRVVLLGFFNCHCLAPDILQGLIKGACIFYIKEVSI